MIKQKTYDTLYQGGFTMNNKKTTSFVALSIIVLVFVFLFSSCGGGNNDTPNEPQNEKTHTISFTVDNEVYHTSTVKENEKVELPESPEKAGYSFSGWFLDYDVWQTPFVNGVTVSKDTIVYAKWTINEYEVDLNKELSVAGSILGEGTYVYSEAITITATTNKGYTWLGWYDDETLVSESLSYSFNMPANDVAYTAKWIECPKNVTQNMVAAGSITDIDGRQLGKNETITATTNDGYTWLGWYDGDTLLTSDLSYTFEMNKSEQTFVAKWTYYTLTTEKNIATAGTSTIITSEKYTVGEKVTLSASTNDGYTWLGWYNGTTLVSKDLSCEVEMPANNIVYTATWMECPVTVSKNIAEAGSVTSINGKVIGATETISATTNKGYTWLGWYDGDTLLTTETTYSFEMSKDAKTYTAKWAAYTVTIDDTYMDGGSIVDCAGGKYTAGEEITLNAQTKSGYTFLGWFQGDVLVSNELTFSFYMPNSDVVCTPKWIICPVVINKNIPEAGTITGLVGTTLGASETITAVTNQGYTWNGWYLNENKVSNDTSYTFVLTESGITITAKWDEYTLTITDNVADAGYTNGYKVTFNMNGSENEAPDTQIVSSTSALVYPEIPTRSGYAFRGWYTTSDCSTLYDFTAEITSDTILYAGWTQMVETYYSIQYVDITTANNTEANPYYGYASSGSSSSSKYYHYFTALTTGNYKLYYKTASSSSSYGIYLGAYNVTQGRTIKSSSSCYSTSWNSVSFKANAGDVIYLQSYDYSKGGSWYFYVEGGSVPTAGGKAPNVSTHYTAGSSISLWATPRLGYDFIGWYENDTLVSSESEYSYTMPNENITLTAKWQVNEDMANFEFVSDGANCKITGVKDKTVTSLVIPSYVTEINYGALNGCGSLTSLTIPFVGVGGNNSSTEYHLFGAIFGTAAYEGGYNVDFEASYNTYTYQIPISLKAVEITGKEIPSYAFSNCSNITEINLSGVSGSIGSKAFYNCSSLEKVTLSEGVTEIGSYAFNKCISLTSITIPSSVKQIYSYAFDGCLSLETASIANGIEDISSNAFSNCASLHTVTIGDSLKYIGSACFSGCYSLKNLTIPFIGYSNEYYYYNNTFGYIFGTTSYTSSYAATQYYDDSNSYTYYIPNSLENVTITKGNGNNYIPYGAFYNCKLIKNITLPDTTTSIGNKAFYNCSALVAFELPKNVTNIGDYAFYYCSALAEINIPATVTNIGENAFYYCTALSKTIIDNTDAWFNITFENASSNPLYYTKSLYIGDEKVTSIEIPTTITQVKSYALYNCDVEKIVIPFGVTELGNYAFYNCVALKELVINASSLKDLETSNYTFYKCGTDENVDGISVTFGKNVTKVPAYLFYPSYDSAPNITSVTFENVSNCKSVGQYAFYNCKNLATCVLPDSIQTIDTYAFAGCQALTAINIPVSVKALGSYAFANCTGVTSIKYNAISCSDLFSYTSYGNAQAFNNVGSAVSGYTLTIGNTVQRIPNYLFYNSNSNYYFNANAVVFEEGSVCKEIGQYAFYNNAQLKEITLPSSITAISENAFGNCYNLVRIRNLSDVTLNWCNEYCEVVSGETAWASELTTDANGYTLYTYNGKAYLLGYTGESVNIDLSALSIDEVTKYAFAYRNIETVIWNSAVTKIPDYCFYYCNKLKSVEGIENVTEFGNYAFAYCELLDTIDFSKVSIVGSNCFTDCTSIKTAYMSSLTKLGSSAFYGCTALYGASLGSTTEIGSYAFYNCEKLTSISIPSTCTRIYYYAFQNAGLTTATIYGTYNINGSNRSFSGSSSSYATYLKSTYSKYTWTKN